MLDIEGNNVKEKDQLYYLKRLSALEDLNLKHNPVASRSDYLEMVKDVAGPQL